jgi:pSer/pThr/pTyr-binding forkhead associated (FHA) protein
LNINTKALFYLKKQDVLIGRGSECDIRINSEAVSSRHARIHNTSKGWAVSDLDSITEQKLNGRFITQPQLIFDEDMLTFGDKVFIFYDK